MKSNRVWMIFASIFVLASLLLSACEPQVREVIRETTRLVESTTIVQATTIVETTRMVEVTPTSPAPGRYLIGELSGATVLTDAAQIPASFGEAPALAKLVEEGKLPKVEERLPAEPLVLQPQDEIGVYGGTLKRGFTGPGDHYNGKRTAVMDRPLFFDFSVNQVVPNLAAGYEVSEDGKTTTLFLREGAKWSDGQPLTADDFMFWYEKIYLNTSLTLSRTPLLQSGGKEGIIEKVDDFSIAFKFEAPYFIFPEVLAGFNTLSSPGTFGFQGGGGVAPAHYLQQFHPDFTPLADLQAKAKEAGYDDWTKLFLAKNSWELNTELPVLAAWMTTTPANTPLWTIERNPYFWAVDSAGNQLPYIDKMTFSIAENLEVLNLRAISGEYSFQDRHVDLQKLPLYLENQERGAYKVYLDPSENGSNAQWRWNMSYEEDAELAKWINNKDFRHAISIGIDRDQINETFFLGLGTPGSPIPAPTNPYFPGEEFRTLWHNLDPAMANQLLDSIGLDKKDSAGYRLRSDGAGRLTIEVEAISGQFVPYDKLAEMIKDQLKEIGIDVNPLVVERSLATERHNNNQHQVHLWDNGNADRMFSGGNNLFPNDSGNSMGPLYAQWYLTNGAEGKEPIAEMKAWMETWRAALVLPEAERIKTGQELWKIYVEETWVSGLVGLSPATGGVRIVKTNMGNVPGRIVIGTDSWNPMSSRLETWYFKP